MTNIDKLKQFGFIDYSSLNEEEQLLAVKQHGSFIKYIKNPTENVQLEAVKQHGFSIRFIKDPSEEVILCYITYNNDYSILNIKSFSEELINKIIDIFSIKDVLE